MKSDTNLKIEEITLSCPWCEYKTNKARNLSLHARKKHKKTKEEIYKIFHPDINPHCPECGRERYLIDVVQGYKRCGKCSFKKAMTGRPGWSKGLTKKTDPRLAKSAENMRKHYQLHGHHNTGKTKENDEGIRKKAQKTSEGLKRHYQNNEHWAKGLTKETSKVIRKRVETIKKIYENKVVIFTDEHLEKLRKSHLLTHDVVESRLLRKNIKPLEEYVDSTTLMRLECLNCHNEFRRKTGQVFNNNAKCPICYPPWASKTSRWQREVFDFVSKISSDAKLNDRKILSSKEFDIYVPSKNFAIECNGLYWHNESAGKFDKNHAEVKRKLSIENNVNLFTIFEDEWEHKRQILESMISHRMNASSTTIMARKCKIIIQRKPSKLRKFFDENHIDGYAKSSIGICLIDEFDNVVGACTLRWAKNYSSKDTLEIARLCFIKNTHIAGGLSRLISKTKAISKEFGASNLVTYSDNRFGGQGYTKSGFSFVRETPIRFWWTDCRQRYDRFKYRADKKNGLTEAQVAENAGVSKIYGCSNSYYFMKV